MNPPFKAPQRHCAFALSSFQLALCSALLVLGPPATSAWAQNADSAATASELNAVVVAASRGQAKVEQMPLHTTIVTADDIRASAATTLDQVLRNVTGLNFTGVPSPQSDPTGQQTKMRGLGNAKVLVLLDGVPIHDPFYLTTQWFKVPLSQIERIEVVRGGNSSLWGNMAVAGVINIVSKRPTDQAGEINASVGADGSHQVAVNKNVVLSRSLSLNLELDQLISEGFQIAPIDQQWRFPGKAPAKAADTNLQVSAFYKPSADLSGYLRLGYHIQDQYISYVYGNNLQKSPDLSASLTQRLDPHASVTATAWEQTVGFEKYNGSSCYWQASGTHCPSAASVTSAQINNQVVQYYTQHSSQHYGEQGASLIYSRDLPGWVKSLQVGLDYRHLNALDNEFFYATPTSLSSLQTLASSTHGQADQAFAGVFSQVRVVPIDPLEITASARFDHWANTGRVNTRTTAAGLSSGGPQADSSKSALDPSLALRYALNDDLALRAAAYKSFRAPGFNNTTRTYGASSPTIANPNLGPENLVGRELGLDWHHNGLSLSATYYEYDIKNMIATFKVNSYSTAPDLVRAICAANNGANLSNCGGSASFYTNDQNGRSRGLELDGQWRLNPYWDLSASYAHTDSVLTWRGAVVTDPIKVQLAATPWNVATAGLHYQASKALKLSAQARYIGRMYIDTTSLPGQYVAQGGNTVVDASLGYAANSQTDLSASVSNLGGHTYSENAYTYNQPWNRTLSQARTLNLGLRYRF